MKRSLDMTHYSRPNESGGLPSMQEHLTGAEDDDIERMQGRSSNSFAALPVVPSAQSPNINLRRHRRINDPNQANEPASTSRGDRPSLRIPKNDHLTTISKMNARPQVKRGTTREENAETFKGGDTIPSKFATAAVTILRKVVALISLDDDGYDFTKVGGYISFVQDTIIGLFIGILIISALLCLDFFGVYHTRHSHELIRALPSVNDPETIATIEKHSDLKLMPWPEYEIKHEEILGKTLSNMKESLEKQTNEMEKYLKEIGHVKDEYDELMSHPMLELKRYCGDCKWSRDGKVSCDARVQFLQDTHETSLIMAKINVTKHPSCKKG